MHKVLEVVVILTLFLLLILVRAFEGVLFYDPLLLYFEGAHLTNPFPDINLLKLFFSYAFRFFLNTLISIAILKIAFPKQIKLKTISGFYILAFAVLSIIFFVLMGLKLDVGYLIIFYIRRFIIQPIFILVLFPLFYLLKKGYTFSS